MKHAHITPPGPQHRGKHCQSCDGRGEVKRVRCVPCNGVGYVRAHIQAASLSAAERFEALMGRTGWSVADYREAGREDFDRANAERRVPWTGVVADERRKTAIHAFVQLNCPAAKLKVHREAINLEFAA